MATPLSAAHIIDRPGYFGKRRREIEAGYTARFGPGGWQECWQVRGRIYSFAEAVTLYDEAYYQHICDSDSAMKETLLDWICTFRECFDHDPTNIDAGVTHDPAAVPRHLQDVSVRRALVRLGRWFDPAGKELLHIRGPETNGHALMPGNVPFHRPGWILVDGGPTKDWMKPGSVEHFWQKNKIICFV